MRRFKPWQVWSVDLAPVQGREQVGVRPCVVVSSAEALRLTGGALVSVLPMTRTDRGWPHHVRVTLPSGTTHVMTDQVRTVTAGRFVGTAPAAVLGPAEVTDVRFWLGRLLA